MSKRIFPDSIVSGASAIKATKIDGLVVTTKPVAHYFKHTIDSGDTLTMMDDGLLTHLVNKTGSSVTLTVDGVAISVASGFSLQSIPVASGMTITSTGMLTLYIEPMLVST